MIARKIAVALYLAVVAFLATCGVWAATKYCEGLGCLAIDLVWIFWAVLYCITLAAAVAAVKLRGLPRGQILRPLVRVAIRAHLLLSLAPVVYVLSQGR